MYQENEHLNPGEETTPQNEMPRYEAPQYEAPRYEAPRYEQPHFEPPRYTPPQYQPPKSKKKNSGLTGKIIALALCCSLVGGALGAAGTALLIGKTNNPANKETTNVLEGKRPNTVIDVNTIDTDKLMTPAEVYAANVNSTVGITTSVTTNFWGYQTTSAASGSGFVLSADGYILTNHHVIEDSSAITVAMYDGTTYDAELIGYDASNDIAVLKVEATDLTPVVLGDSDNLNVGDSVVAIGNPLGELTFSLTQGVVSAMDRQVTMSTGVTMNLIQTDCSINSGNSGGALFNLYGEVIGITNAKYSNNGSSMEASIENIGFAIPLNHVRSIVDSIIENGYIAKPYIGVSVTDVSAETQSYGLPQGAAVKQVVADSPAEKAGLQVNDIITEVNGQAITGSQDLVSVVGKASVNDELNLKVYRQGSTIDLTIVVGEQIQSAIVEEEETQTPSQQMPQTIPGWNWGFGY